MAFLRDVWETVGRNPELLLVWGTVATGLLARSRVVTRLLPARVVKLLANPRRRRELLAIIGELAALSHLSNAERRARAARRIAAWLKERNIELSGHEVNLLVESLVHVGKGSR
jgi:hypothetical protein